MSEPQNTMTAKMISVSVVLILIVAGGYWAFTSAFDQSNAHRTKLVITGSSTVEPLIYEIAKRFEQENPGYRIDVQAGGSSRGISDAKSGTADIGMASRELKSSEEDGLVVRPVAVDGIGMIVHRDNPVSQLTGEDVLKIYLGQISNWSELGGEDKKIIVINKASGRGTLECFLNHFKLKEETIQADLIVGENQQAIISVLNDSAAIGYVSIGAADAEIKNGAELKLLSLDGVSASVNSVADGTFPISRKLNLVIQEEKWEAVKAFVEFATSDRVHDLVESQFFVPVAN